MIEITEKKKCCGCSACANICPKQCISMKKDEEGFLYPVVDKSKCINCGICERICPIINKNIYSGEKKESYAVFNKNDEIRKKSTSGGFFTALAEKIIDLDGYVFGVAFDKNFNIVHMKTNIKEELYKFRGSKYVQSFIGDTYKEVKKLLERNVYVLYSGTPCQIYGLKAFLGKEYDKLYCVDVICKGVPSPGVWEIYKKNKEKKQRIKRINFREKTYGFNSTTMSIYYENGRDYHKGHESDEMLNLFVSELISRPSCYECNFKGMDRASDFTIGDCWQVEKMLPQIEDDKGATLLIVHSKKAKKLLSTLNNISINEIPLSMSLDLNGRNKKSMYLESAKPNPKREDFYRDFQKLAYNDLMKKYCPRTIKTRMKCVLKPILYKLGILNKLKNIKKERL